MTDLFQHSTVSSFAERAISPMREIGAYEALWCRQGTWFKSLADIFREHPGSVASDVVSDAEGAKYARLALAAIRAAGIKHFGVRVHGTGEYPARLRDAENPIELLYFQGLWDLVNTPCIAIIGTRHPTDAGKRRAARLAKLCVADGYTVVAGLARGIDTIAHTTAIAEKGCTIAVLGTPITECYPPENRGLQHTIADHHLVISQVPIVRYASEHIRTRPHYFPERNATMSALSEATVVVEAGDTSGALVQARHALEQGRLLFILDSCFQVPSRIWPAKLLAQGAVRVSDYEEIKKHLVTANSRQAAQD
jgi:DNA processing protein